MIKITEENCIEACEKLWRRLSETPTTKTPFELVFDWKNKVLKELGYEKTMFGCPLCEVFYEEENCPLGDCLNYPGICEEITPYGEYQEKFIIKNNTHYKSLAKRFYEYMKEHGVFNEVVKDDE